MEDLERGWNSSDAVTSKDFYRLAKPTASGRSLKEIRSGIVKAIEWGFNDLRKPYSPTWDVDKNDIPLDGILREVLCLVVWPEDSMEIGNCQFDPRLVDLLRMPLNLEEMMMGSKRGILLGGIILEIFGLHTDIIQVASMEQYSEGIRMRLLNRIDWWFKSDRMKKEYKRWRFSKDNGFLVDPKMYSYPEWMGIQTDTGTI